MNSTPSLTRRSTALAAVTALCAAGLVATVPGATSAQAAPTPVVISPNPAYQGPAFEGWGTSLVWFANATGDYPEEIREELYQLLFGEEGLNLNVARYNIGGGNASDVPDYLRQGAAVEGWWAPDLDGTDGITSNYKDRAAYLAAWDADDDASYNWGADATQRWWVEKLATTRDDMVWEAFSNSPPYFMTKSGFVTGSMNKTDKQLLPTGDAPQKFVTYLTRVTEHLEDTYGINFKTVDPFNEPCNGYWGTPALGTNGWPKTGGTVQEGAQICPGTGANDQQNVINLLSTSLAGSTTDAIISANDETNPGQFVNAWNQYDAQTRAAVGQVNVHTYGTGSRLIARDIAKTNDKPLWMSEVGGDFVGTGFNPTTITGGLGMAQRITDDLRELEPNSWVFWQEVEDYYNMEKVENLNWGSIFIDFDCNEPGTVGYSERRLKDAGWTTGEPLPDVAKCKIVTNSKFNTARNYTQYIRPGDHVVPTNNTQSTAAITADGTGARVVHINDSASARSVTLDLSKFADVADGATVTPVVTTEVTDPEHPEANALVTGGPVKIPTGATSVTIEIPARSVTTFVIDGVSGSAEGALPVQDGTTVQLVGVGSNRALTASATSTTITDLATTGTTVGTQLWTTHALPQGEGSHALRYVLTTADDRVLGATTAGTELRSQTVEAAKADPSSWWTLSTTDGTTWSFINGALSQALEVGGQATANGSSVGLWTSSGGSHQRWTVRDTSIISVPDTAISTIAGVAPTLPTSVVPVYSYGNGVAAPVVWETLPASVWDTPGTITVSGQGTDVFGNTFESRAVVDVGGFTSTDPVSITTYAGASLTSIQGGAPSAVPAQIGISPQRFDAPVTWDWSGLTDADLASEGVLTIAGSATSNDPSAGPVPATLSVILTAASESNVAPKVSSAVASSAESGYPIARTYNLSTGDKGWSNWVSSNKPTTSTLQYTFATPQDVQHVTTYFYRDGTTSWAQTMTVDYLDGSTWVSVPDPALAVPTPAGGGAPIVDIDLGGVRTTSIRLTLNAYANTHMIVSEVEIYAKTASPSTVADLGALRVDGTMVAGFSPDVESYDVTTTGSRYPRVTAVPIDSDATLAIDQPTEANGGIATVVATSVGGTTRTYTVDVARQAVVSTVAIAGQVTAGKTVTATSVADPAGATATYRWLLDGAQVGEGAEHTLGAADVGKALTVAATAGYDGFVDSTEVHSAPVVVQAAIPDPGTPNPGTEPGTEPGTDPGLTDPGTTDPEPGTPPTDTGSEPPVVPGSTTPFAVTLSSATVRAGGALTVTVVGASSGGSVEVWLHSSPVRVAVIEADAAGTASRTITVPASTPTGTHRIQVVDTTTGLSVWSGDVVVSAAATPPGAGLAATGSEITSIAILAMLLVGAGAFVVRRRRRAFEV